MALVLWLHANTMKQKQNGNVASNETKLAKHSNKEIGSGSRFATSIYLHDNLKWAE